MKTEAAVTVGVENAVADTATRAVYATSAGTVVANLTIGEWAALIGIGATLATFAANVYFRARADKREQQLHERRLRVPAPRTKSSR